MSTLTARVTALETDVKSIGSDLKLILAHLEAGAPAKVTQPKAEPKVNNFVADQRAKRLVRREANPLGGLTKAERKAIAATLKPGYSRATWVKAVKAYKAA